MAPLASDGMLTALRAAGEPTRLRILALLADGERSVKDLTDILGQSQPRISRHLKLLADAGLLRRHPEGAWAFFRLAEDGGGAEVARDIVSRLDRADPVLARDRGRLDALRQANAEIAADYFRRHAARWDELSSLHVKDRQVEEAMLARLGDEDIGTLVDLGTGTGRMLELLQPRISRGIGVDLSHDMLSYARSRLDREGLSVCQVRLGDIYNVPLDDDIADAVTIHQVLHYLDEPDRALAEATRLLRPGGRIVVVDFAPHGLEFLRSDHAHRRLGFAREQMTEWLSAAGVDVADYIEFPHEAGDTDEGGRLTVALWLGRRLAASATQPALSEEAA